VADVPKLGVNAAAEKHGVSQTCVSRWAAAAGVRREAPPAPPSARKPKATARSAKAKAQPAPPPKQQPAAAPKREEPVAASEPTSAEPPVRRTLKTRVARLYTPSQKAVVLEDAAKDGVTAAATKHKVSRFAIYAWQRKVAKAAEGQGPSPTSGPSPCEIAEQRDKEILDAPSPRPQGERQHGPPRDGGRGYRPPKVERKPHDQRFEAVRPNHMWHLDFVQRNIHRANTFTLILIDDHSRYVVGNGVDEGAERADLAQ